MKHVLADNGVLNLGGGVTFKIPLWYDDLAKTGLVPRYSGDSIGVTRGVCGVGVTRVGGGRLDGLPLVGMSKVGLCLHAACVTGNGCVKKQQTPHRSRTGDLISPHGCTFSPGMVYLAALFAANQPLPPLLLA